MLAPPSGGLAPPPTGNPGSTPVLSNKLGYSFGIWQRKFEVIRQKLEIPMSKIVNVAPT